jgi:5-formyltetrahydrofolate cyclo-ligase
MVVEGKKELRRQLRARRDALSIAARHEASARIAERFLDEADVRLASRVALYAAIGSEVETAGLFEGLAAAGVEVCFPRSLPDQGVVEFSPAGSLAELTPGAYDIREPTRAPVQLDTLDVVAVPGVAFDETGARLGYGAGYYDRTLASFRGICIGLAYDAQLVDRVPTDDHDRRMDVIITERATLRVQSDAGSVSPTGGPPCQT